MVELYLHSPIRLHRNNFKFTGLSDERQRMRETERDLLMPSSKHAIRAIGLLINARNLVSILVNNLIRHAFANSLWTRCLYPEVHNNDQRTSLSSVAKIISTCSRQRFHKFTL
jgi:hypothetical protein